MRPECDALERAAKRKSIGQGNIFDQRNASRNRKDEVSGSARVNVMFDVTELTDLQPLGPRDSLDCLTSKLTFAKSRRRTKHDDRLTGNDPVNDTGMDIVVGHKEYRFTHPIWHSYYQVGTAYARRFT